MESTMTESADGPASRRARIREAFAEAIDTPTLARGAFIARLRDESAEIADEVESLLRYHGAAADVPEALTQPLLAGILGASIGGCEIERLIGVGGTSIVYAATERFPHRRVALKFVRPERLTPAAQRRIRVEAEALARLEHPNIARVFGAGVHRVGAQPSAPIQDFPYLVMELVPDARPLTRFANDRALGVRERILLVASIADAIEHAHRAGVIHRDLKPGNVLVDANGVPKVIDFGIAAVTDSTVTAATEGPMGTLAYMSPEQARGRDTDTRSDVWGLGALLHDLLAGRPPFDAVESSLAAHLEKLLQGSLAPIEPLVAAKLGEDAASLLPAATDAVLRMALAPEPSARYRSAAEFAEELRNLIDGQPLRARADSRWDIVRRSARRHRRAIAVAAGFTAVVTAALAAVSISLARTTVANERAQWSSYVASISAASGLLDQGDGSAAWAMLRSAPPEHRGWEWNALARRADAAAGRLEFGRQIIEGNADPRGRLNQVYDLAYSLDGSTLFIAATAFLAAVDAKTLEDRWRAEHPLEFAAWRHRPLASGESLALDLGGSVLRLDALGRVARTRKIEPPRFLVTDGLQRRAFMATKARIEELDVDTLEPLRVFPIDPPFAGPIRSLACSHDAAWLAASDEAGSMIVWDVATGRVRWRRATTPDAAEVRALVFSRDGNRLATCGAGFVSMLATATGQPLWKADAPTRGPSTIEFLADESAVVVGNFDESIDLRDAATGERIRRVHGAHSQVWSLAVSPDGTAFAAGAFNANTSVFPADANSDILAIPLDGSAVRGVSPGRRTMAVTADGGLFEIKGNTAHRIALNGRASAVCEAPNGGIFVGLDAGIAWIDAENREIRRTATASRVEAIGVVDGGRVVVARLIDETHVGFDAKSGELRWSQDGMKEHANVAIETAQPNRLLLARGTLRTVLLVDAESGLATTLDHPFEYPRVAALSPDRRTIALGTIEADGEVALMDAARLEPIARLANHRRPVDAIAWSPDGARIASASLDNTVRIWHAERRVELLTVWRGECNDLAFDARGCLWLACADGMLRVIDGSSKETLTVKKIADGTLTALPHP
jgi:serine/threonine protein kinase/WD40 repeat protein